MPSPTHCVDCGKKLKSMYRSMDDGDICDPCYWKRIERGKRGVKTWMYLHREEIGLVGIPIEVIEYCSQAFGSWSWDLKDVGYHIAYSPVETRKIPIGPALLKYGTACGMIGNKFNIDAVKFLVDHSAEGFIVAEVELPDMICNMAVKWKDDNGEKVIDGDGDLIPERDHWSYQFTDLVYGFGGSLRPDCVDYDGWDTFESE